MNAMFRDEFDVINRAVSLSLSDTGEWQNVLVRAGIFDATRRRRVSAFRLAVAAAAGLALIAIPLTALALSQNWFASEAPKPATSVVQLASGSLKDGTWTLDAYTSVDNGICINFRAGTSGEGGGGCGSGIVGEPNLSDQKVSERHWVGYFGGSSSRGLSWVAGPTAAPVTVVKAVLTDGRSFSLTTRPMPGLDTSLRFYIATFDGIARLAELDALGQAGKVLERRHVPARAAPNF